MRRAVTWLGTLLAIAGALLVAANIGAVRLGYGLFLASSVIWLAVAARRRDWPLASMQAVFAAINVLGLARW